LVDADDIFSVNHLVYRHDTFESSRSPFWRVFQKCLTGQSNGLGDGFFADTASPFLPPPAPARVVP
jgi:hypothetical protein